MSNRLILTFVLLSWPGACPALHAALAFQFNYNDPSGSGFNDLTLGATRKSALELAATNFATAFSGYTATVVMNVDGTASGSTLASAGSEVGGAQMNGFGLNEVVRNKILNGTDLNGGSADGAVSVNFSINWQLNIGAAVGGAEYDWYSTMYHELAHAVGFSSGIFTNNSGTMARDAFNTDPSMPGSFFSFDQFLSDFSGMSVFSSGSNLDEATYESLLVGGNSASNLGLFFNGTNAKAANSNNPVGLYTPTTFSQGSSGSHTDDQNSAYMGQMMLSATNTGPSARTFSAIEQGIFKDIGYSMVGQISAVPEASAVLCLGSVAVLLTFCKAAGRTRRCAGIRCP